MNRMLVCCLVVFGLEFFVFSAARADTISGTVFDLDSPPKPRKNFNITIQVVGIGKNAFNQPFVIPLPPAKLKSDGTFEIVINNPDVRAVTLFFLGSEDGLQDVRLERVLNQTQTINVTLPDAEPTCSYEVYRFKKRCRLFRH